MNNRDKEIYQHFSNEDRSFIDKAFEWLNRVEDSYHFFVTPFLNPHQVRILQTLGNHMQINIFASSEIWATENARVIVAPDYYVLDENDFEMDLLEIAYAKRFNRLHHNQILGTLIHHLGIERWTFGDILVADTQAQLVVDRRFSQYFIDHISKIAKVPVNLKVVPWTKMLKIGTSAKTINVLSSSLRLDKIVASVFKLSRNNAAALISGGAVKVNYTVVDNVSYLLNLGDMISVRRFGRARLIENKGLSRNNKHKLTVEVLVSK
ncbi:RNA-binding protein [Streptococcus massiliensis]|uniref:S4 domain-containing protein n=1 Tax=Streptococcus massiliensis TaxID=313439 RepID=A0A380KZR8_9STRE|nr:YlmH/Sll1252 family protein [Streptococcus massiliensis]SUN77494.1 S4 domain-containing protein [Streptococcus massiliensis]